MNKEKQIEEMAKTMCKNYGGCSKCMFFPSCDVKSFAMRLHENGYRKSADVAEEIFAEIEEKGKVDEPIVEYYILSCSELAELKKKYTESEKEE